MVMHTPKRKYFESRGGTSTPVDKKMFLVRHHDITEDKILERGPYRDEDEAIGVLNSYLKNGVCSWLVTYNG